MNRHTENDLSYNHTKLDYQALVKTARVAYALNLERIYNSYNELRDTQSNTKRCLEAERLAQYAQNMAVIADTLATLLEGLDREELEIVNKPMTELYCPECGQLIHADYEAIIEQDCPFCYKRITPIIGGKV